MVELYLISVGCLAWKKEWVRSNDKLNADSYEHLSARRMLDLGPEIMVRCGCQYATAFAVATHLLETHQMGVVSHGVMRLVQYAEQMQTGYMDPAATPQLRQNDQGAWLVDGRDGVGIVACQLAIEHGIRAAQETGLSATAIINCGHTGRLSAFVEQGANAGFLTILIGGGRKVWHQLVALAEQLGIGGFDS